MEYTINSRKLGKPVTFYSSGNGGYIYVNLNGKEGTLGHQICSGGCLYGDTLTAYDNDFVRICRLWWRNYLRLEFD